MSVTQLHSIGEGSRPNLQDPMSETFRQVGRMTLGILSNVCQAEGVEGVALAGEGEDPGQVRRELLFVVHKLGYLAPILGRDGEPPSDTRTAMKLLRSALPVEASSLALIFVVRALCEYDPENALMELGAASEWARSAGLSPL